MRRPATIALLAMVVLAGCPSKTPPPDASATTSTTAVTTATAQPATTTTLNLSAQPTFAQLHDTAYWNAILAALNRVVGDAFRSAVVTRAVEPSAVDALREVYGPTVFSGQYESLVEISEGKDNGLIIPPGDPVASVTSIVKADERCVALTTSLDYGKVNPRIPTANNVVELRARGESESAVNPTPWTIAELFIIGAPDDRSRLCAG